VSQTVLDGGKPACEAADGRTTERRPARRADGESPVEREGGNADARRWWVLVVVALAQLMIVLDATVVTVALPSAQHALHVSLANRQWVLSAYTLAFGTLLLLGGRVADYVGRRRTFVIGLLGFATASALGGLAQNQGMLFGARALQGVFAALMAPASLSLLTVTFVEPTERARAFGVYGGIAGGGAALGLLLGGVLTQLASWRWTLLVNVPIAAVAALAAWRVVRRDRPERARGTAGRARYDLPGVVTSTSGLFLLVLGFSYAGSHGWTSLATIGMLACGLVLVAGFVAIELRSRNPLLPLRVVLESNRAGAYLSSLLVGVGLLGTFLFLTYFLQGTLHYSALRTGFAFLPFSGGIIVGAALASRFLPRTGPRALMTVGLLMAVAGMAWFTQLSPTSSYLVNLFPAEIVTSLGLGLTFVPMSSTALVGVDTRDAGVASALVNTTQQVGGSLGIALLNTVAASATASFLASRRSTANLLAAATVHGYVVGFIVSTALLGAAALVVIGLIRGTRPPSEVGGPAERGPTQWSPGRPATAIE